MDLLTKRRNMELALKLLLFFIGMGLSMAGIMTALHSVHMVLGVLIFFSGFVILFSSMRPNY
jgi:membrane-bound ClpP family serine protease